MEAKQLRNNGASAMKPEGAFHIDTVQEENRGSATEKPVKVPPNRKLGVIEYTKGKPRKEINVYIAARR